MTTRKTARKDPPQKAAAPAPGTRVDQLLDDVARMPASVARQEALRRIVREMSGAKAERRVPAGRVYRFGLISCSHVGSHCADYAGLTAFYEACAAEGVHEVYHCGDVLDGHRVYRGQEFELECVGFEGQVHALATRWPQVRGIRTRFITGNHDLSFKSASGVAVGHTIAERRADFDWLGDEEADIILEQAGQEPLRMRLLHPGGGASYALSYRPQKIVDSLAGGNKPDVLAIGHFHKAEWMPSYRNMVVVQAGTFQRQTPFMARMGLAAHVGGWIVELSTVRGARRIRGEFVAFF